MSTKTITIGPKIKTALPGPNAKRVLEATRNTFRRPTPVRIPSWPSMAEVSSLPTWMATSSSISLPALL